MGTRIQLALNPETGIYETSTIEVPEGAGGELEQAGIRDFASASFGGVPIGGAIIGSLAAGALDVLIRLIPIADLPGIAIPTNIRRGITFGIASWAAQTQPVRDFLGAEGARAASLILAADAIQEFVNVRALIPGLFGGAAAGGGGTGDQLNASGMNALRQQLAANNGNLNQVPAIAQGRQALAGL